MGNLFSSDLVINVQPVKLPAKVLKAVPKVDAKSMTADKAVPKLRDARANAISKVEILGPASTTLGQDIASLTARKEAINKVLQEATNSRNHYTQNLSALAALSGGAGTNALGTLLKKT